MLMILGIIAFLQMTVIPGFIIINYFRLNPESKLQTIVYTFGFSLAFNYIMVYILTAFEIYRPLTMYFILVIEIILLVYIRVHPGENKAARFSIKAFLDSNTHFYNALLLCCVGVIAFFFKIWVSRFWEVFYLNDAVLSWNRWALDWFHNQFPVDTWFYPQLLSTNWSTAYMIMQNPDIQFVTRNIMVFFTIGTALLFMDLGIRKRNSAYFVGLIVYGMITNYLFTPEFIADGYTEIPVAFFAFLSFYVLHQMDSPSQFNIKNSLISIVFASTAAQTKQAGLFILLFIIAWNIVLFVKNRASFSWKTILKTAGVIALIILVIVLSWYLNRVYNIMYGFEKPGIKIVTQDIHQGRTYMERLSYGFHRILEVDGKKSNVLPWLWVGAFFLLCSLFHKRSRYITLFIVFPYILIWGFFFSYDHRNISLAIPFAAFSTGIGAHWITGKMYRLIRNFPKIQRSHLAAVAIVLLITLNFTLFKEDKIIHNQLTQQRKIGLEGLNKKLYEYVDKNGFEGKVFSKYTYFRFLPGLKNYWAPERDSYGVCYYLEDFFVTNKETLREIKKRIKTGEYKILFKLNQYWLIKVKNNR